MASTFAQNMRTLTIGSLSFQKAQCWVPAGTVFEYAGHLIGSLMDPKDSALFEGRGITPEEKKRRTSLIAEDMSIDRKHSSAAVTTNPITLMKNAPCALAPARPVLSNEWGWVLPSIVGDSDIYYQAGAVIKRGALDTSLDDDSAPIEFLSSRGELNASVRGTLSNPLDLDAMSASLPPDNSPVLGVGNSECFGDSSRQDISCRALTEDFLMSVRGATRAEVTKAMNVNGREIKRGLHFLSLYSQSQRWGSGDVNFMFDGQGRVSVIDALLDPPGDKGPRAEFIWNANLLPDGCSDSPITHLKRCP